MLTLVDEAKKVKNNLRSAIGYALLLFIPY